MSKLSYSIRSSAFLIPCPQSKWRIPISHIFWNLPANHTSPRTFADVGMKFNDSKFLFAPNLTSSGEGCHLSQGPPTFAPVFTVSSFVLSSVLQGHANGWRFVCAEIGHLHLQRAPLSATSSTGVSGTVSSWSSSIHEGVMSGVLFAMSTSFDLEPACAKIV